MENLKMPQPKTEKLLWDFDLPNRRLEAWKYTSFENLAHLDLRMPSNDLGTESLPYEPSPVFEESYKIFVLDFDAFYFDPELEPYTYMEEADKVEKDYLVDINTHYAQDKLRFVIPKNTKLEKPVEIFYFAGETTLVNGQLEITLEEGAELSLVEHYEGDNGAFSNFVKTIDLNQGSVMHHTMFQLEDHESCHYQKTEIQTQENAHYHGFIVNNGALKARIEIEADIVGQNGSVNVSGINLIDEERLNDITLFYKHVAENCNSRQHFKTVLADKATGVFQGKIYVDQQAQKTDGYQLNNALILSDKAQMNSKPELEIYADDVKCSHGATTGQVDMDSLFYLRSRGLTKAQATSLLIEAFVGEAILDIKDEQTQGYVKDIASQWLGDHR